LSPTLADWSIQARDSKGNSDHSRENQAQKETNVATTFPKPGDSPASKNVDAGTVVARAIVDGGSSPAVVLLALCAG
jgi:hypothetical protein